MATISIADDVKALAEARAAESGYASVDEFVEALLRAEVTAATPGGPTVDSDEDLEQVLLRRLDDGSQGVEMDAADFERMRTKLRASFEADPGRK